MTPVYESAGRTLEKTGNDFVVGVEIVRRSTRRQRVIVVAVCCCNHTPFQLTPTLQLPHVNCIHHFSR